MTTDAATVDQHPPEVGLLLALVDARQRADDALAEIDALDAPARSLLAEIGPKQFRTADAFYRAVADAADVSQGHARKAVAEGKSARVLDFALRLVLSRCATPASSSARAIPALAA